MISPGFLRRIFTVAIVIAFVSSCSDSPSGPDDHTAPDWHVLSTGKSFSTVWAFAKNDIWTSSGAHLYHYDGTVWRMNGAPQELLPSVSDAWFASDNVGFLVGHQGKIVRYWRGSLDVMQSPTDKSLYAVWGAGREAVYAVGHAGQVVFFNGREWRPQPTPGDPDSSAALFDVWGSRADDVFAVGFNGTILHFDGSEWRQMESGTDVTLRGVWGSASDNVFAVGYNGTLLHYQNRVWTPLASGTSSDLYAIGGTGDSDIVVTGSRVTLRFDGQTWDTEDTDAVISHLYSDPRYGVFGAGSEGRVVLFEGQSSKSLLRGTGRDYAASWADEQSLFVTGGPDARRFQNGEWTDYKNVFPGILTDVWGVTSNDIFVCGASQYVLRFRGTDWERLDTGANQPILRSIWGTSNTNVFFAGSEHVSSRVVGVMLHHDGAGFTRMEWFEDPYYGVWGTSENDAFAVGDRGLIAHFDGTKWTRMQSGTTDDLWCVWGDAPDRYFAASRRGRIYAYDGQSWQPFEFQAHSSIYDLWGDGSTVYASATQDGVYCLDRDNWSPLDVPYGNTYLSARGYRDVGVYLTGRSGLVLFSPNY